MNLFRYTNISVACLEQRVLQLVQTINYALKRVGLDNEKEYTIAVKAIKNNFYMDDFINSVENPEEAIEVFNQLQPLLSRQGFELKKKWKSNNDAFEDLKSISNPKQVEVEPNTEGSSVLEKKQ